jgi:hypothetical protein
LLRFEGLGACLKQTGAILANGYSRFMPRYVKTFPLPKLTHLKDTIPFERLTDTIMINNPKQT